MRDFKKRNSFGGDRGERREGGGGGFRKPGGFQRTDGRSFERSQMYPAVCSKCNKACEIPFKPNGQRPVYCSNCFGSMKEAGVSAGGFAPKRDFGAPRRDYDAPAISAPVMKVEDSRINDLRRQMDGINSKLDRLIESVTLLAKPRVVTPEIKKEEKPVIVKFAGKPMKGAIKSSPKKAVKKEVVKKKKNNF